MTTHATPAPLRGRTPGAVVEPVDLPDPSGLCTTAPAEVRAHLTQMETARQRQLDALPSQGLDAVTAAYRATVERILGEVRDALARLEAGVYGTCAGCAGEIPAGRLELRPWATRCARCAADDRC
ncbi:TraR/DksA family transcriptional regulator [Nocardioides pakistanensis]